MVLPATWHMFDFDPATQGWSIDRMVRRALGTSDRLEPLRREPLGELFDAMADTITVVFCGAAS